MSKLDLNNAALMVMEWQRETFEADASSLYGAVKHLLEEAQEVNSSYRNVIFGVDDCADHFREELADVFFLLMRCCDLAGVDLPLEVCAKLEKNKKHEWTKTPDCFGKFRRVR